MNSCIPEWFASSYFLGVLAIYAWFEIKPPHGGRLVWRDQEPMELLLALGFLVLTVSKGWRWRRCLANESAAVRAPG